MDALRRTRAIAQRQRKRRTTERLAGAQTAPRAGGRRCGFQRYGHHIGVVERSALSPEDSLGGEWVDLPRKFR